MFACLYAPPDPVCHGLVAAGGREALVAIAQAFVPRFDVPRDDLVMLDVRGLGRILGEPHQIGVELRRAAADRGLRVHVALAATRTAAWLLAHARAGLTCVEPGGEGAALAPLPIGLLQTLVSPLRSLAKAPAAMPSEGHGNPERGIGVSSRRGWGQVETEAPAAMPSRGQANPRRGIGVSSAWGWGPTRTELMLTDPLPVFRRWGLTTLGDLAALPAAALSARLGQAGLAWQHLARGGDPAQPMVPWTGDERFQASLELEWPIEGLEPLSFVLSRLLDPLAADLARRDRAAAVLHLRLGLVTRAVFTRSLRLLAPIRDPGVLRTLMRLDLESHPPGAGIETVAIDIEPAPGPIVQESLLERARPAPEQITTLMARLAALVGDTRCGAPALVDSNRPGAFAMTAFGAHGHERLRPCRARDREIPSEASASVPRGGGAPRALKNADRAPETLPGVLRRFRRPIPVRVGVEQGCPVQVTIDRPDLRGGPVERCAGPWRTSGKWWRACGSREAEPSRRARARGGGAPRALNNADPPWVRDGAPQRQERLRPCRAEDLEIRGEASAKPRGGGGAPPQLNNADPPWDRDEWDIALASGLVCRLFRERDTQGWFIDALMD